MKINIPTKVCNCYNYSGTESIGLCYLPMWDIWADSTYPWEIPRLISLETLSLGRRHAIFDTTSDLFGMQS